MLLRKALGGAAPVTCVDDVFSAFTYTGNGATQTINNGIDLAGKGGMVWVKSRSVAKSNTLFDTSRTGLLVTDQTSSQSSGYLPTYINFTPSGFFLDASGGSTYNSNGESLVSWTFRKAPKFFDIVTYTGNGVVGRQIPHALSCEVGIVMTKATSTTGDWNTYHRSATGDLVLNTTVAQTGSHAIVTAASSTTFTVTGVANTNGVIYVAYLFAHDPSSDGLIQCGSYTGNGANPGIAQTLGWEPQFLLIKRSDSTGDWTSMDASRGLSADGLSTPYLIANTDVAETSTTIVSPTAIGFTPRSAGGANWNANTGTYIYLAIRRSNKPPKLGTDVYNAIARTGTSAAATVTGVGFAPDLVIPTGRSGAGAQGFGFNDRLRGANSLIRSSYTSAEVSDTTGLLSFDMDGYHAGADSGYTNINYNTTPYINHFFKRAVGVFDQVCYTGTGVAKTEAHNLGVVPELMIVKSRSAGSSWFVTGNAFAVTEDIVLDSVNAKVTNASLRWDSTRPTSTVFSIGTGSQTNTSSSTYVAYLFATLAGISKVGSYLGNGTSQTIPCGFSTGARFILIKRTDLTGAWYVWDTVRGIVAGNDPHLSLNSTAAEVTTDDSIDPDGSGFIVNQNTATNINVLNGSYIFLAMA
jgi:hypothetical protein